MDAADQFLAYMAGDRACSPQTVATYRESLTSFRLYFRSLDAGLDWECIDADVVRRWMAVEMERGKVARTVVKDLSALRSLYRYLLRMGRISADPLRLVRNPKVHAPLPTFVKQREMDYLFDEVPFPDTYEGMRDRTILLTFYHTGVRVSELVGLDVPAVNPAQGELRVTGKRNKQRVVPYGEELAQALRTYMARRASEFGCETAVGPLFLSRKGVRMTDGQVRTIVRHYLSLVTTQKKKSPHVLRHTFATVMLNNGADLEAIKELLGHESIHTTEVYTHTTFAELKKEYEQAHPRA